MVSSSILGKVRAILPSKLAESLPVKDSHLAIRIAQVFVVCFLIRLILHRINSGTPRAFKHCQEPPGIVARLPFQLDALYKDIQAYKANCIPQMMQEMHNNRGNTVRAHVLGGTSTITIEPENIKAILATQFQDFGLGERNSLLRPLLGDGVFTLDGKAWEQSRALLRPQFAKEQVADLDSAEKHVQIMFEAIEKGSSVEKGIDLQPIFGRFTTDSATEFLFGESTYSQQAALMTSSTPFADSFDIAQEYVVSRMRWGPIRYFLRVPQKDIQICHEFVERYVQKALLPVEKDEAKYVFSRAIAEQTSNKTLIRDQLLNILLAGRDTTRSLLSWTVWSLARDRRVLLKLQTEIKERFGNRVPNYTDLKEFTYLRYVVSEVLRLYPSVPFNVRFAVRDTTIPTGGGPAGTGHVFIPDGTPVSYSVMALHRRKDLYGEDAESFRPERWGEKTIGRNWEYLPFNGGPRICLGQQYALTEVGYVIVRLLQQFKEIKLVDPDETEAGRFSVSLTLVVAGGCNVHLTKY